MGQNLPDGNQSSRSASKRPPSTRSTCRAGLCLRLDATARTRSPPSPPWSVLISALACVVVVGASSSQAQGSAPVQPATGVAPKEAVAPAPNAITDAERFRRGQNHFEFGDCKKVVTTLQELSSPGRLNNDDRLVETHRMLGVCYFQLGKKSDAERELKSLLYISSNYELDPFLTPPPVVELFTRLRSEVIRKLKEIDSTKDIKKETPSLVIERQVIQQETPLIAIFMPFGAAQALNGDPWWKSSLLGGLQVLPVVVSGAAFWTAQGVVFANEGSTKFEPLPDGSDGPELNIIRGAIVVGLVAFSATVLAYGYSVADGWWNWEPLREIDRSESQRPFTDEDKKRLK